MSEIKLDIPDITVLIDKGDEYKVIVNKPGSVVKNITGSFLSYADVANSASYSETSSFAITASYAANVPATASSAITASYALTASYASNVPLTASYAISASQAVNSDLAISASNVLYDNIGNKPTLVSSSTQVLLDEITGTTFSNAAFLFPENLTVGGTLTAEKFITEYISSSVIYESGSTKFGDSKDDTHQFTGSLLVSGNIDASGYSIIAASLTGSFSGSINNAVTASYVNPSGLPSGTVSSSVQVEITSTTGYTTFSSSIATKDASQDAAIAQLSVATGSYATTGSNIFIGQQKVTGSIDTTTSVKSREFVLNAGEVSVVFTGSVTSGIFGATEYVHPFIPTSSFMAASVEYVAIRQGALRVGTLMSGWSGSTIMMTDVSTTDIGDTSDIRFTFIQNDGYVKLRVESVGSGSYAWTVQSLFKLFPTLL